MLKKMRKLMILAGVVAMGLAGVSQPVFAEGDCRVFAGLVSWDCNTGLTSGNEMSENGLITGVWTAAANVATDITIVAAYLVVGFVIYGGYLYMFAYGDTSKVANGKKTLTQAFIGLAIVMLAHVILNAIRIALFNTSDNSFVTNCATEECVDPGVMVTNMIGWVVGVAGVVAAVFVVYGGVGYMTSAGDPNKLQKAKTVITYALIGLAIVALAEVITAFVSSMIREAAQTGYLIKEEYEYL